MHACLLHSILLYYNIIKYDAAVGARACPLLQRTGNVGGIAGHTRTHHHHHVVYTRTYARTCRQPPLITAEGAEVWTLSLFL
eukprot:COSAG01_NODE_1635_length_9663_cov_75.743831_8_plen_82_part_00